MADALAATRSGSRGRAQRARAATWQARNELERRFLRLCQRHHLPVPEVNALLLGYEVDFLWPFAKLVVETDGYAAHSGRATFEHDHRRETRLVAAGYEVLRFTWLQVLETPPEVVAALRVRLMPVLSVCE